MLKLYLRILSVAYLLVGLIHALDLCDLRLKFSQMDGLWKTWTVYLVLSDLLAAVGLWKATRSGELVFLWMALSQIAVFVLWSPHLGDQYGLIAFHLTSLGIYLGLLSYLNTSDAVES